MEKVAKKLLDENKISQDEYESVKGMTKEAFLGLLVGSKGTLTPMAKKIREIAQLGTLAGIGTLIGSQAAGKAGSIIKSYSAYDKMMEKMPSLSEFPEDQVKDFYSVVKTFSPKAASNPLVAGALVNKMLQFGGVDHKLVQDIAGLEADKKDILSDIVTKAGQSFVDFKSYDS